MALSLGHLASLYNYDMAEYEKAEELYLKSIRIGKLTFIHVLVIHKGMFLIYRKPHTLGKPHFYFGVVVFFMVDQVHFHFYKYILCFQPSTTDSPVSSVGRASGF